MLRLSKLSYANDWLYLLNEMLIIYIYRKQFNICSLYICSLIDFPDATISEPFETHLRGPGFVMEPPGRVEFSNSSGGWLDCSASGSPQPTIDWVHADGTAVTEIHGVRRVLRNGTLVLMPFAAAAYHQDIHNTIYRCIASNSVGRIVSRDVQVRAGMFLRPAK